MKLSQQPRVSLRFSLTQIVLIGSLAIGAIVTCFFLFSGLFSSMHSKAANATLSSGMSVKATADPFTGLSSGDTLFIEGDFEIDKDYDMHSSKAIAIVVDGSNAKIRIRQNKKLHIGSGSSIHLLNGGTITSVGICDRKQTIWFGSSAVANCDGSNGLASFTTINSGGGIGTNGLPLPVSWVDVSGKATSKGEVTISWSTASEINNSHFTIQYSEDTDSWIDGPRVQSKATGGNSNELINYETIHYPPAYASQLYYRIKQTDFDETYDYSKVIRVDIKPKAELVISTLGQNRIRVSQAISHAGSTALRIYNPTGQVVYTGQVGPQIIELPQAGMFIVEVGEGDDLTRIKHMVR